MTNSAFSPRSRPCSKSFLCGGTADILLSSVQARPPCRGGGARFAEKISRDGMPAAFGGAGRGGGGRFPRGRGRKRRARFSEKGLFARGRFHLLFGAVLRRRSSRRRRDVGRRRRDPRADIAKSGAEKKMKKRGKKQLCKSQSCGILIKMQKRRAPWQEHKSWA